MTVLLGGLSLVGAISYSGASAANQEFINTEKEKLKILEDQFNVAKSLEANEIQTDLQTLEAALAEEAAAKVAAQAAIEEAEKNILKDLATVVDEPVASTPEPVSEPSSSGMEFLGSLSSTAYTHTGSNMANGEYPYVGAVACNIVPLGTKIFVEGYGYYVVKDRIGSGSQLDIFFETEAECYNYGRRTVNVYIVHD